MARETLKQFLRSGAYPRGRENPDGIIQYTLDDLVPASDGDRSGLAIEYNSDVPLIGFDAADPESGLIGNFLHYITTDAGNFYEFKRGNQETNAGNRGEHLQDQDKFLAVPPHVPQGTVEDALMSSYSNSGYFNDPATPEIDELFDIVSKVDGAPLGSGENAPRGANELLRGVYIPEESSGESDFVVSATVAALKRNNRFNMDADAVYLDDTGPQGVDESEDFQFVREEKDYYTSLESLKDAGASQLLKASGYDLTDYPVNQENFIKDLERNIVSGDAEASLPANTESDYSPKINVKSLLGMNATGVPKISSFPGSPSVRDGTGVDIPYDEESLNASSFGVTYNQSLRFEDNTEAHKIKTALRMIALYNLITSVYGEIIDEAAKQDKETLADEISGISSSPNTTHPGALIMGQARKSSKFVANNWIFNNFLTPTDFPYGECFNRGIQVIFGDDASSSGKVSSNLNKIYNSPGFWHAMSNVALKKTFLFTDKIKRLSEISDAGQGPQDAIRGIIDEFGSIAKIANIFAIIGEKSLHFTNARNGGGDSPTEKVNNPRDVDALDNIPGNRVGKSRKKVSSAGATSGDLGSETTLSWEQSDVPSAYLLPLNIVRAAADLNNTTTRVNPSRGMLGSRLVRNTYTGIDTDGTAARIPPTVVKILEDRLDAEYVPFYFQDLRTNEIVSFHAFLSQLTDSISPTFNSVQGYGRIDPVKIYQHTTRTIQVGFTVYATNREDFDDMWFKINKFVTMLYPQWTEGQLVQVGDKVDYGSFFTSLAGAEGARFVQPFSQVIGATPIVRMRVGDVVKSNYSRFALARTFGIGDQGVKAQPLGYWSLNNAFANFARDFRDIGIAIVGALFGSPQGLIQMAADAINSAQPVVNVAKNTAAQIGAELLGEVLLNGFVNPLITLGTINRLRDPNVFGGSGFDAGGFVGKPLAYLNPNMIDGYHSLKTGNRYFTTKRLLIRIDGIEKGENDKKAYKVKVVDKSDSSLEDEELLVRHEDIWNDPSETFSKSIAGLVFLAAGLDLAGIGDLILKNEARKGRGAGIAANIGAAIISILLENPESQFMRPEVNPFVKAFHASRGRGLAGTIEGVTFNWLDDYPWETDYNSRAPIGCNINFNFSVIHDIPPGLDHTGFNRAPIYNVGEVMRNTAGDVYDDRFSRSELKFRQGGSNVLSPGKHVTKKGK